MTFVEFHERFTSNKEIIRIVISDVKDLQSKYNVDVTDAISMRKHAVNYIPCILDLHKSKN
jgi:hypothetical protein